MDEKIAQYIEIEREIHPWADDQLLERIVRDELKADPNYYESKGEEPKVEIEIGAEKEDGEDPFPIEK